jgi:hypothetical protein
MIIIELWARKCPFWPFIRVDGFSAPAPRSSVVEDSFTLGDLTMWWIILGLGRKRPIHPTMTATAPNLMLA